MSGLLFNSQKIARQTHPVGRRQSLADLARVISHGALPLHPGCAIAHQGHDTESPLLLITATRAGWMTKMLIWPLHVPWIL